MQNSSLMMENILDRCIKSIEEQGLPLEECLTGYPSSQREELEPLLRLAVRLQTGNNMVAPPEFRQAAAARMANLIAARPQKAGEKKPLESSSRQTGRAPGWVQKRTIGKAFGPVIGEGLQTLLLWTRQRAGLAALVGILLIVLLVTGQNVASAAGRSVPGDQFYPLKSTLESVQLAISLSDTGDARLHLSFARRRLIEAEVLIEKANLEFLNESLRDYNTQVETALTFLADDRKVPPEDRAELAALLVKDLSSMEAQLYSIRARSPVEVQTLVITALANTEDGLETARQVLEKLSPWIDTLPGVAIPLPGKTSTPTGTYQPSPVPQAAATPTSSGTEWVEGEYTGIFTLKPTWVAPFWPGEWSDEKPSDPQHDWLEDLPKIWPTGIPTGWPGSVSEDWPTCVPEDWPEDLPDAWPDDWPTLPPGDGSWGSDSQDPSYWPPDPPKPERTPDPDRWPAHDPPPDDPVDSHSWPDWDEWPDSDQYP